MAIARLARCTVARYFIRGACWPSRSFSFGNSQPQVILVALSVTIMPLIGPPVLCCKIPTTTVTSPDLVSWTT